MFAEMSRPSITKTWRRFTGGSATRTGAVTNHDSWQTRHTYYIYRDCLSHKEFLVEYNAKFSSLWYPYQVIRALQIRYLLTYLLDADQMTLRENNRAAKLDSGGPYHFIMGGGNQG